MKKIVLGFVVAFAFATVAPAFAQCGGSPPAAKKRTAAEKKRDLARPSDAEEAKAKAPAK